jgi:hypothetical protein
MELMADLWKFAFCGIELVFETLKDKESVQKYPQKADFHKSAISSIDLLPPTDYSTSRTVMAI